MKLRFFTAILWVVFTATICFAESPLETIKVVYKLLYKYDEKASNAQEVKKEINQYFLLNDMAKEAIKNHWAKMSERQRTEYMKLMYQLLEKGVYQDTHENLMKGKVKFKGERVQGARAKVMTNIYVKSDDIDIDNNFDMKKGSNNWQVKDMIIDGASLVEDYQSQFNKIISEYGIDKSEKSLFARLKRALQDDKSEWRKEKKTSKEKQQNQQQRNTNRRPTLLEK